MKEYVVTYPVPNFRRDTSSVVLIEKAKPEWQAGMWNMVGGSVEPTDDSVIGAAVRELEEETGLKADRWLCRLAGEISGPGYRVYCVLCPYSGHQTPRTTTGERVFTVDINDAVKSPLLIPNLKIVLPLMRAGVDEWRVIGSENEKAETSWSVQFNEG